MSKVEKKSISELVNKVRKPSVVEIDQITEQIHEEAALSVPKTGVTAPKAMTKTPLKVATPKLAADDERIKRMSINTPLGLYLKARNKATLQDLSLMAYILQLVEADTKND